MSPLNENNRVYSKFNNIGIGLSNLYKQIPSVFDSEQHQLQVLTYDIILSFRNWVNCLFPLFAEQLKNGRKIHDDAWGTGSIELTETKTKTKQD